MKNQQILLYQKIQVQTAFWYIITNSFNFFEFLKIFLVNMATVLMMSAEWGTPCLIKIKIFRNESYDDMISDYDVIMRFYHATQVMF